MLTLERRNEGVTTTIEQPACPSVDWVIVE